MPRNIFMNVDEGFALTSNLAMMEMTNLFMDQVVVLKVKHKKTWTKFVRLEVSEQRAKKV